ncbi:40683_t:CDS:1, partial [Gigaspora margarita]
LNSNIKLIELNKKLRIFRRQSYSSYKNEFNNLNEKITNIDIEKAKID